MSMDVHEAVDKWDVVRARMAKLGIHEADLVEKFVLGSGSGGQKINKTSSCVYLKHVPSGVELKCQQSRSRDLNRLLARREMCERMAERIEGERSRRQQEAERVRRQKRRRSRRQKARMLDDKRKHGDKKAMRGRAGMMGVLLAGLLVGTAFGQGAGDGAGGGGGGGERSTSNFQHSTFKVDNGEGVASAETLFGDAGASESAMSIPQAVVLGVVEGLTEYLPVSSTGHLLLAQRFMGIGNEGEAKVAADAYAICIQAGAILAVVGLYFRRLWGVARGLVGADREGLRLGVNLVVGFVPAAGAGLLLEKPIKHWLFGNGAWGLWPIVAAWLVGGVVILAVDRWLRRCRDSGDGRFELAAMTWKMAIVIGAVQCLAMWPGVSRSLATILGGVAVGLSLGAAVEFSFLLGLVTLSASTVLDALKHGDVMLAQYGLLTPLLGMVVAMVSAMAAIAWMVRFLQQRGLAVFGYYRIGIAVATAVRLMRGM